MPRIDRATRDAAVRRVADGESAADVARDIGVKPGAVRLWVHRCKDEPVARIVPDAARVDLTELDPIALLEHDIAEARQDLQAARKASYHNVLPAMRNQIRAMVAELQAMRAGVVDDDEPDDAERLEVLIDHGRVYRWLNGMADDHQCLTMMRRVVAERTD